MSAKVLLAAILFSNGTKCLATKLHFVFPLSFSCPEFLYCGASQKMSDSFGLQTNPFQQHIICHGLFHLVKNTAAASSYPAGYLPLHSLP